MIGNVILAGYDWRIRKAARSPRAFLNAVLGAVNYLRDPATPGNQPGEGEPTLAERFRAAASKLARLYALCSSHKDMGAHRDEVAFFEEIRVWMAKYDAEDRRARGLPIPAEVELYLRQLTAGAVEAGELPGHTPGSAAFYLPATRVLIAGDGLAFRADGQAMPGVFNTDPAQATASLQRLAYLEPRSSAAVTPNRSPATPRPGCGPQSLPPATHSNVPAEQRKNSHSPNTRACQSNFLSWTITIGRHPGQLTQADIDAWHATAAIHEKQGARSFLTWAMTTRHIPTLQLPPIRFSKGEAITQYRRLALLRRYLTDTQPPLRIRVIACLMLLYAQPLSRVLRLATSDITHDEHGQTWIRFGHPATPVPEPFATLIHQQISDRPAGSGGWLFPGRNPGQPAAYGTISTLLRNLSFPMRTARISALRQLVLQAPAPVIAEALGFHHTTTQRQHANAAGTWAHYPSRDHGK